MDAIGGARHHGEGGGDADAQGRRKTSWAGVALGWLAALGAGLALGAAVGAVSGGETAGPVGSLIAPLLAFFVGGAVAGRLAGRRGIRHGLLVAAATVATATALAIAGDLSGLGFLEDPSGVGLPDVPGDAPGNRGVVFTAADVPALLALFVGGAAGGALGAGAGRRRPREGR